MKKLIASVIVATLAIATVQVNAQTLAKNVRKEHKEEKKAEHKELRKMEGKEVSSRARGNFISDFGDIAGVTWVRGPQFDEATFNRNGEPTVAYYDYDSKLVGTTVNKKFSDLPLKAQKEIKKRYRDYVTGAVVLFDDNDANDTNMSFYGTQFEDVDHYFVTISKGTKEAVLMVKTDGTVSYFKQLS